MFKKSFLAIAVLGATTFSAQAFTLPHNNTTNPNADAAAGWMVNANFSAVNKELNSQQEKIELNKDAIAANKDAISANKDAIDLGNRVNNVQNQQIGQLQSQNVTQDKNIAANKDAIAANKDAISANKDAIDLGNRVNNVQNQQIGQLQSQNVTQDKNIAANKDAIAANKDAIAANAETIAKNYTEMKNNFTAVNQRIDDLDEEMKKGFASQAALAGLFQPYNVGKFNLSVALGGYESEQAMALGTGYRFNENFAMKAGIATDVGGFDHLTYNIGANFEW